jgi:glycosyltransferase involved in cell wall biosynthesis
MNLYAGPAARVLRAMSVGGLRSSLGTCREEFGHLTPLLMNVCDALVTNSHMACAEVRRAGIMQPERIHILPNGIDTEPFRNIERSNQRAEDFTVLYLGRLVKSKRIDVYLRSLAAARAKVPSVRGVIAGEGPELNNLRELARSLGLAEDHVSFVGHQSDIAQLFRRTACLVLTSDAEGCPNVILEAMAAGLPVISTPAGDARHAVEHGRTGFVVPFGRWPSIADSIVSLATSREASTAMGLAGRARVEQLYGTTHIASRLLAIYAAVARRTGIGVPPILQSQCTITL